MKLISDKEHNNGRKIAFSDQDEWGYTSNGIIFTADHEYLITGLELYSAKLGVIRCDKNAKITYCQAWEKDSLKQGIGIAGNMATKLISSEKESLDLFEKVYNHTYHNLKITYLKEIIHGLIKEKKKITLNLSSFKEVDTAKNTHQPKSENIIKKINFFSRKK